MIPDQSETSMVTRLCMSTVAWKMLKCYAAAQISLTAVLTPLVTGWPWQCQVASFIHIKKFAFA